MGGGRLGLGGGFGWALRRGAGVAGSGGGESTRRQQPAQLGFRPKQGASSSGPTLGGGRGKGRSGVPTGIREQRRRPALQGAGSRAGDRKYAAAREELRMSVGRRGASLGRPGGAVGVPFGGPDPSGSAHFPGRGMGRGPGEGPGRGGRLT